MRRLPQQVSKAILFASVVGCGFNPGAPGESLSGTGASSVGTTGAGGANGGGGTLGIGLTSGNGGGGSGEFGTGTGGMTCGTSAVPVMPEPPDILIIQDKSGSMDEDDTGTSCRNGCGANSKWTHLTTALSAVVLNTDMTVNWGLKYFSDSNPCSASGAPAVKIGAMNGTAVTSSIMGTRPGGNTPTRDAITSGAAYLATLTDTNPKFLLLATDGLPNCPAGCASMSNPMGMCTTTDNPTEDTAVEAAIMMAAMQGYQTFVIGIGNVATAQNTLNQVAINGGQAQTGAATSYYAATDEASLEAALNKIVGVVASCTIPLTGVPANLSNVAVSVDDASGNPTKVPEDSTNGWEYTDTTKTAIQLHGMYCDSVKAGTYTNVKFVYACDGVPICIDKLANGQCGD
jgi:hypothetical protein